MADFPTSEPDAAGRGAVDRLAERVEWSLFPPDEAVFLVAVSGGADSVFLAHALVTRARQRAWTIILAHVHHGLRGPEADEDWRYVENLARKLGVEFTGSRLEPRQIEPGPDEDFDLEAQGAGTSLEGRLRLARWGVLAALARARQCDAIVTGHNRDDLAETFLLQALRGAGLTGLGSMAARGRWEDIEVLRPLLEISREEIRAALAADEIAWREDQTNRDRGFKRNWLRLEILPAMEAYQKGILGALARTARICGDESEELRRQGRDWMARAAPRARAVLATSAQAIDWAILSEATPVLRHHALRVWLAEAFGFPLGPPQDAILDLERVAKGAARSGGERLVVSIPGLLAWTDGRWILAGPSRDHARVTRSELLGRITPWFIEWRDLWNLPLVFDSMNTMGIPVHLPSGAAGEKDSWEEQRCEIGALAALRFQAGPAGTLPKTWKKDWAEDLRRERCAVFDRARVQEPLAVRFPQPGDRMPLRGGGHKEIAQALAEAGVPEALRARVPLVCDTEGPLWLVGIRRAARAFVTRQTTSVLVLRAEARS